MKNFIGAVNVNRLYLGALGCLRSYFCASASKEQLNGRLRSFYKLLAPLFLRNGPFLRQDEDVLKRGNFLLDHTTEGERVLDVGCFDGYFTKQLSGCGRIVEGVDSLDLVIETARKNDPDGKYAVMYAEQLDFPIDTFDCAIYSHILEHVFDPDKIIKEASRVIKPQGKIVVIVPYTIGVDANHLREYSRTDLESQVGKYFKSVQSFDAVGNGHACIGTNCK